MMQKRKSYLSLLLASFLLLFTYSFAAAQTYEISFEGGVDGKDVPRCVTADMSVYVTSDDALGAFEAIFEVGGNFTGFSFTLGTLPFSGDFDVDGNVVRVYGFMGDEELDACLSAGTTTIGTLHFDTEDVCVGAITVVSATVDDPFTHGSLFVGCDPIEDIPLDFVDGLLNIVNQAPTIVCPGDQIVHYGETVMFDVTGNDFDLCEVLTYSLDKDAQGGPTPDAVNIDFSTGRVTWGTGFDDICEHVIRVRLTDKCGATVTCDVNVCVQNDKPAFTDLFNAGAMTDEDGFDYVAGYSGFDVNDPEKNTIYTGWGVFLGIEFPATDPEGGDLTYTIIEDGFVHTDGPAPALPAYPEEGYSIFGDGGNTFVWSIGAEDAYSGDFTMTVEVTDGANTCGELPEGCSPENADTITINIHVTGYGAGIDLVESSEGSEHGVIQGTSVEVPIRINSTVDSKGTGMDPIGGFDFRLVYDASALTALSVTRGDAIDTEFEYFTYRFDDNCGGGCPSGMIHIIGLRETNDGITNDEHVIIPDELFVINFYVSTNLTFECQFVPIRFFWLDCTDNTMSDESGDILYVAADVYDWNGTLLDDPNEFGITGPMDLVNGECYIQSVAPNAKTLPMAFIVFYNGGIKITCINDIDDRGDVNLNGIAYEVADAVVFTNYFINGLSAFTINIPGQTAATDINADGTPLSVADLVYLIRIIVGDALPYAGNLASKLTPSDPINVGFNGDIVDLRGTTTVGAALFVFDREIIPTLTDNANHMNIKYGYLNGRTQVLVYSMEHRSLGAGDVLTIEGEANLVGVEAADHFGVPLEVEKTIVVPTEFALNQNYPNPFNPETVIGLAMPVASNWNIAIYNVSGQLVKEFAGYSEAGTVQVIWDATNVASGLYFYKATTDQFSATKKMVLLK